MQIKEYHKDNKKQDVWQMITVAVNEAEGVLEARQSTK